MFDSSEVFTLGALLVILTVVDFGDGGRRVSRPISRHRGSGNTRITHSRPSPVRHTSPGRTSFARPRPSPVRYQSPGRTSNTNTRPTPGRYQSPGRTSNTNTRPTPGRYQSPVRTGLTLPLSIPARYQDPGHISVIHTQPIPVRYQDPGHISVIQTQPYAVNQYVNNEYFSSNSPAVVQTTEAVSVCTAPSFESGLQFSVEECQQQANLQFCQSSRARVGWTGVTSCSFKSSSLKYHSTCSSSGEWDPPFYTSCSDLFQASLLTSQGTSTGDPDPSQTKAIIPYNSPPAAVNSGNSVVGGKRPVGQILPSYPPSRPAVNPGNLPPFGLPSLPERAPPTSTLPPPAVSAVTSPNKINFYSPQLDIRDVTESSKASQVTRPTDQSRTTNSPTSVPHQLSKTNALPGTEVKCPPLLHMSPGVKIECTFRNGDVQTTSCGDPVPVGSEAKYSCQDFYETTAGVASLYRKCQEDGTWTGNGDQYGCVVQCGRSNVVRTPYITRGTPSVRGQWPWHAALFLGDRSVSSFEWEYICGGTLIGHRTILTAAHCVTYEETAEVRNSSSLRIDLGKYHREEVDEFVQSFEVQNIMVHPSYSPFGYDSDIALVILKGSVKVGYAVRPICYPQTSDSGVEELQLSDKSVGTVVGWGKDATGNLSDILHVAVLPVVSPRACLENVQESLATQLQTRSTTFCAGYTNGTNVCNGDSGGGMYFPFKNSDSTRWFLQGIVSVGIPDSQGNCDPTKYSVFTRVGRYADWILRQLTQDSA